MFGRLRRWTNEWTSDTFGRGLAGGRRHAREKPGIHFLEEEIAVIAGVRFISSTTASGVLALVALLAPAFPGPTVAVTHYAPEDAAGLFRSDVWIYVDGPEVDMSENGTRRIRGVGRIVEVAGN